LDNLRELTPAAALLMVAAFDRWKEIAPYQRLTAFPENWHPNVRRRLGEMGFFSVLNAKCDIIDAPDPVEDRFLPFLTGRRTEGDQAKTLRQGIESLGPRLADPSALYDGIVEAMTNVKQHAYPPTEKIPRWWMSASVNVANRRLTVMFLDHGQGIPTTLPRSRVWEMIRDRSAQLGLESLTKNDAELIKAALTTEKSRTGDEHRGNGLRHDIRGYVELHQAHGRLRILSRRGRCVYERDPMGHESFQTDPLPVPMRGTFLEWTIEEYGDNE
jgi:hypothetical protein